MTGASGPAGESAGPGARSPGPEAGNPGLGARGTGPGTGNPEPGARGTGPGAGNPGPGARSTGPGTGSPGARTPSPGRGDGEGGAEPDARFTFANERTFLAWSRTALALIVAGLGIVQLLPPFPGVPWGRHLIGVPLIALGAIVAIAGYAEWVLNQRALRRGAPIPQSVLPVILTVTITAMALLSASVLLLSATR